MIDRHEEELLENWIARRNIGLRGVVAVLSNICQKKAAHIQKHWQDKSLAASWQRDEKRLDDLASKLEN